MIGTMVMVIALWVAATIEKRILREAVSDLSMRKVASNAIRAFLLLVGRTKISKFTPAQATSAIVVSYYWHFVDIVWIALFAVIYFVR